MSAYVCHASTIIWFFTPPGHSACAVAFPNIFSIFFFSLSINKKRKKKKFKQKSGRQKAKLSNRMERV